MKKIDPVGLFFWLLLIIIDIILAQYDTAWSYRATLLINFGVIVLCVWDKKQN